MHNEVAELILKCTTESFPKIRYHVDDDIILNLPDSFRIQIGNIANHIINDLDGSR